MKSSVMNIHDFGGCNLIFTMNTGKHVYIINVVQRLTCLDIIATKVIFIFLSYISLGTWQRLGSLTRNRITLIGGSLSLSKDGAFDKDII